MGSLAKSVAVVAALSVLVVLLTPAFDELPCSGCHKSGRQLPFITHATWALLQEITDAAKRVSPAIRLCPLHNPRSLSCIFLC